MIYLLLMACNPTDDKENVVDDTVVDELDTGGVSEEYTTCRVG